MMIIGNLEINLAGVVIAAVAYAVIGPIWYSKWVFGPLWMRLNGLPMDLEKDYPPTAYLSGFLLCFIAVFSLAAVLEGLLVESVEEAASLSAGIGAGFVFTATGTTGLFVSRPLGLWLIDNMYHVLGLTVAGAILAWM